MDDDDDDDDDVCYKHLPFHHLSVNRLQMYELLLKRGENKMLLKKIIT